MQVTREFRDDLVDRVRLLTYVIAALLVAIASGFWFVQVVQGSYYRSLADNNRLRKLPMRAPRGLIYDRGGRLLVENIPSYNLMLDRSRSNDIGRSLTFAARILGRSPAELKKRLDGDRGIPDFQPVLLASRLTLSEVARFGVSSLESPEFEIDVEPLRLYRHGTQTGHVLGYLGEVSEADLDAHPDRFSPGDLVGKRGVEQTYDALLRGRDGRRVVVVDSRGKVLEEYGRVPVEPGHNLHLTIDLDLQQEAERQMRGRVGAVVALDPRNGDVRAMYSSPAFDPNAFARGLSQKEWLDLLSAPYNPLQNRVFQNPQSPGSVFKIVMALAGLTEGEIRPDDRVYCSGSTVIYGRRFRCWKHGGHGWVNLRQAIEQSCNVYFYQLGFKLGIERIARYARLLGLGTATGIPLAGERSGVVPDPLWSQRVRNTPWWPGETISVAIGQGALSATPLQVARLLGAVATGDRLVRPRLVTSSPVEAQALALDPSALAAIRAGLEAAVNEPRGTAFGQGRIPGLTIAGKTGTAQVVAQGPSPADDSVPYERRDHAWFASYAPAEDPKLVVVVFVEHGGHGASAAAPVARALYESYFKDRLGHPAAR